MAESEQTGMQLARTGTAGGAGFGSAAALAGKARARLAAMHPVRRRQLGAAVLFGAAVLAVLFWYANRPDWRPLYSGLESKDLQQVAQELSAANIPYQMTEDGSGIQVGADQMDRARMEIATKGMPQTGRMGFELFDKPNWVGSEFDEKVNYQRALEGELEHTISALAVVRSARVHLVLPKDAEFGDAPRQAKASVLLQLRRSSIPPEQVDAIRSLVAGAVENLAAGDVALVDADGKLNLSAPSQGQVAGNEGRALENNLTAMLEPLAGPGNVRATVNISYDEGSEEKTDEVYDPTQVAALTMHRSQQSSADGRPRAAGIPGTASNTPGATVASSVQNSGKGSAVPPLLQTSASSAQPANSAQNSLPVYPQGNAPAGESVTDENGTYAVTRHLSHSEVGPGRIRRVTAAIVVNDRIMTEGSGKQAHTVWKPRTPDEMQRLQQLARAAVGFDATRGDEVLVENIGFSSNQPDVPPSAIGRVMDQADGLLHAQPGLLRTASFSLVALLVIFAVLKPISRQIATTLNQVPAALATSANQANVSAQTPGPISFGALPSSTQDADAQALYRHIAEQVRKEPAQSARVVESWINARAEEVG
jgi:flagellar M-ring protein FliF